jgi:hypothetical protein
MQVLYYNFHSLKNLNIADMFLHFGVKYISKYITAKGNFLASYSTMVFTIIDRFNFINRLALIII